MNSLILSLFLLGSLLVPFLLQASSSPNSFDSLNPDQSIFHKNSPSTIASGISLKHSHIFYYTQDHSALFYRGGEPYLASHYQDLKKMGIDHVIIFKEQVKNEVDKERAVLTRLGLSSTVIPMPWSEFPDPEKACSLVKEMLLTLEESERGQKKTYLHCTVGEDRTSMADALWNFWRSFQEQRQEASQNEVLLKEFFKQRMCHYGYAEGLGSRSKPVAVSEKINRDLTPLYTAIFWEIVRLKENHLPLEKLNCDNLITESRELNCL